MTRVGENVVVQRVDGSPGTVLAVISDGATGDEVVLSETEVGGVRLALGALFPDGDSAPFAALNLILCSIETDEVHITTSDEVDERVIALLATLEPDALRTLGFAARILGVLVNARQDDLRIADLPKES